MRLVLLGLHGRWQGAPSILETKATFQASGWGHRAKPRWSELWFMAKAFFNWRNVGHVLRRPGDLAVQRGSCAWLCLFATTASWTTTVHHTGWDSFWFSANDRTWRPKTKLHCVDEAHRKCLLHKSTTSHFPQNAAGLFKSSFQVMFGLPALVVTLVWGSSVDPAPTPCYSHFSFLAWLFLFYVFSSSNFFFFFSLTSLKGALHLFDTVC